MCVCVCENRGTPGPYLIVDPHGVDVLQLPRPVLRLVLWDVCHHKKIHVSQCVTFTRRAAGLPE